MDLCVCVAAVARGGSEMVVSEDMQVFFIFSAHEQGKRISVIQDHRFLNLNIISHSDFPIRTATVSHPTFTHLALVRTRSGQTD